MVLERSRRKRQVVTLLRAIVIALGLAALFWLLGLFYGLGYFGGASTSVVSKDPFGFWLVRADCDITFNPFLYSFSWLTGNGYISPSFLYVSVPTYFGGPVDSPYGGHYLDIVWRNTEDLEEEATLIAVLSQIYVNIPFNFAVVLTIELAKIRDLYFCLIGGILGFPLGGSVGAVVGFFVATLAMIFIIPKLRKGTFGTKPRIR